MQARVSGTEMGSLTSEWYLGGRGLVFMPLKSKILSCGCFRASRAGGPRADPVWGEHPDL